MTLTEVHDNPELLARLLGVPFTPGIEWERPYGYGPAVAAEVSAAAYVRNAWRDCRASLEAEWQKSAHNPHKPQTWGQFIAECLREGLGIRRPGKLADKLDFARMSRPDLYAPPNGLGARDQQRRDRTAAISPAVAGAALAYAVGAA